MRPLLPPRDAALRLLAVLGAVIALIGIGLDLLPSASPSALFRNALHLLEALHLSYLNPREALDAQRDYAPDGHWSSAGHQKIAGLLEQCLRAFFARGDFVDCA